MICAGSGSTQQTYFLTNHQTWFSDPGFEKKKERKQVSVIVMAIRYSHEQFVCFNVYVNNIRLWTINKDNNYQYSQYNQWFVWFPGNPGLHPIMAEEGSWQLDKRGRLDETSEPRDLHEYRLLLEAYRKWKSARIHTDKGFPPKKKNHVVGRRISPNKVKTLSKNKANNSLESFPFFSCMYSVCLKVERSFDY